MNAQTPRHSLSSLLEVKANAGHVRMLSPSPAAERIQELESTVDTLRSALKEIAKEARNDVCCCGAPMEDHGPLSDHSPVDEVSHYIQSVLDRTGGLA